MAGGGDGGGLTLGLHHPDGNSGATPNAVQTTRSHSIGLLAQSVGGGGAVGNEVKTEVDGGFTGSVSAGVGDTGGDGGGSSVGYVLGSPSDLIAWADGGAVEIAREDRALQTVGTDSTGSVAQSVRGGTAVNDGRAVTVRVSGSQLLYTTGQGAHATSAQSAGCGILSGQYGSFAARFQGSSGSGGTVDVAVDGLLATTGENSMAILAQSTGPDGGGTISFAVDASVTGGTMEGAAVRMGQGSASTGKEANSIFVSAAGKMTAGGLGSAEEGYLAIYEGGGCQPAPGPGRRGGDRRPGAECRHGDFRHPDADRMLDRQGGHCRPNPAGRRWSRDRDAAGQQLCQTAAARLEIGVGKADSCVA